MMILEIFGSVFVALLVSFLSHLLVVAARNREKYKFFEENAPGLKVIENPNLFGGHVNQYVYVKYNWSKCEATLKRLDTPTFGFFIGDKPAVVTTDLDFVKTFIVDEQIHVNRINLNIPFKEIEEDCIMFAEDEQWLRLRKVIGPAFASHKIKNPNVLEEINAVIGKFIGMVERRLDEAQAQRDELFFEDDAEDLCQRYALAQLFTSFYKQDKEIDFEAKEEKWAHIMDKILKDFIGISMKLCAALPILKPPMNWLILNFHEQGVLRHAIMGFIRQQTELNFEAARQAKVRIDKREANFDANNFTLKDGSRFKRNMIDFIIDQYREGKLTRSEYMNSTFFLWFAADKAVSDALSRILYNLAHHQEVQDRLRESILISGFDSQYLSWVILESLRLHPPVPIGCSRTIKRDIQTRHGLIPAGTFVCTPARTINRLPEYWGSDAHQFKPERWANAKSFHPCQYLAFGGGRRGCPGRELATMQCKMVVNQLMRRYRFDKSTQHTLDNSDLFDAPIFAFLLFDTPSYVRISRLQTTEI